MDKDRIDELIDKYVLDSLKGDEKRELDALIDNDPSIKKEIKMRNDISKSINYVNDKNLRAVLEEIHGEEFGTSRSLSKKTKFLLGSALFIIIIGAITFLLNGMNKSKDVDSEALFAQNYSPYIASVESRNTQTVIDNEEFFNAYRNQEYRRALQIVEPSLKKPSSDILLLAAVSAIEVGEWNKSIELLDRILEEEDYYFGDHAKWYKALILLKTDRINESRSLLEELKSDSKADHYDEAMNLLNHL